VNRRDQSVIVVIEDDPGMRGSLEFLLESHGFAVAAFATPEAVLEKFPSLATKCAILDIHLPGVDGMALYEKLIAQRAEYPAIFITGRIDERTRTESRRLGAVALLEKPFSDSALLDAVYRAIDRSSAV
jgi:two-component system response regulator FixJ